MVLEDLTASGCRFPRPRDDDIGETAGRIVVELAQLHAHFWDDPRLDDRSRVDHRRGTRVSFGRPSNYIPLARRTFRRRDGPGLPSARRAVRRAVRARWRRCCGRGTPTLIHGDAHLGNLLVDEADGGRPGFFDWAMVWRANGLRDVAYVLGNSIPTDVRREGEQRMDPALRRHAGRRAGSPSMSTTRSSSTGTTRCTPGRRPRAPPRWVRCGNRRRIGQGGMRRATATIEDLDSVGALEAQLD